MRMHTRTHEKTSDRPQRFWIEVVEVDDDHGRKFRRRHRFLPSLHVGITAVEPGPKLQARWRRKMNKKPGIWVGLRPDLMDAIEFDDRSAAESHKRTMVATLSAMGYTVNGDLTVYSVYVIELDHSHLPDCTGYFYVGQTAKSPVERVIEHRDGKRKGNRRLYSLEAHRRFVKWRPDISRQWTHFSRESALQAESLLRLALEQRGYRVIGGQEKYEQLSESTDENPSSEAHLT